MSLSTQLLRHITLTFIRFYGLGFNNPGTLAKLWTTQDVPVDSDDPSWLANSSAVLYYKDIYHVLNLNARDSIFTVCIGSILGAVAIVYYADKWDRRKLLVRSFLVLAAGLLITGVSFPYLFHKNGINYFLVLFYALIQFGFSFGPSEYTSRLSLGKQD
jgi:MFS transporter, PHS family, inorganic phosphate transporter